MTSPTAQLAAFAARPALRRHSRVRGPQDRGPAGGLVRLRRRRPRLAPGGKHHALRPGHGAAGCARLRHARGRPERGDHQPRVDQPLPGGHGQRRRLACGRAGRRAQRLGVPPGHGRLSRRRGGGAGHRRQRPAAADGVRRRATRSASASASSWAARTTRCSTPPAPPARWPPPRRSATCWVWTRRRCSMPSVRPAPSRPGCGNSCAPPPTASSCTPRTPPPPA